MSGVNSCPGCGHRFYEGGSGLCKWCKEEQANPSYCVICGSVATCSGNKGYLCDSRSCWEADDLSANVEED